MKRKCIKCSKETGIYLPHHRLALCQEHYTAWFESRTQRTITEFRMMTGSDKILVAVSGGKDSLSLWNALVKLGYDADGLHINLGIPEYSELSQKKTQEFAERVGRKLHVVEIKTDFGRTIPEISKIERRPPCSFCGTLKRYFMNLYAKKGGYTVVATGHNLDDETAVLMLNTLNWNTEYLARQYPVLPEGDGLAKKVKPFCKMTEKETAFYAVINGIDFVEDECPFAVGSTTIIYKKILSQIEQKFPGTKIRFYSEFLAKMYPMIRGSREAPKIGKCNMCGEPTQSSICLVCRMKIRAS